MDRNPFMGISILILFVSPILGQTQTKPQMNPQFVCAIPEGNTLRFDSPLEIDWDSLIPDSLKSLLKNPTEPAAWKKIIGSRNQFGYTSFEFDLPLAATLQSGFCYLVSDAGISEIRPVRMVGSLSFDVNSAEKKNIGRVISSGKIVATPKKPEEKLAGGFVFCFDREFKPVTTLASHGPDDLHGNINYSKRGSDFWKIVNQYAFEIADRQYVFVRWAGDDGCLEACCQHRLYLYEQQGARLKKLKQNDFGCDI